MWFRRPPLSVVGMAQERRCEMPTSPPRPVFKPISARRLYAGIAALAAAALLAAAAPVPVLGADTAAACNSSSGSCGG
jgi:hypothetical protein